MLCTMKTKNAADLMVHVAKPVAKGLLVAYQWKHKAQRLTGPSIHRIGFRKGELVEIPMRTFRITDTLWLCGIREMPLWGESPAGWDVRCATLTEMVALSKAQRVILADDSINWPRGFPAPLGGRALYVRIY